MDAEAQKHARRKVSHSVIDILLNRRFRLKPRLYRILPIPRKLPPEALVGTGFAMAVTSGLAFSQSADGWWGAAAALFAVLYWLCDLVDGEHARQTGQCRNGGELLDHFADPLAISIVAVGVGFSISSTWLGFVSALLVYANAYLVMLRTSITGVLIMPRMGTAEAVAAAVILGVGSTLCATTGHQQGGEIFRTAMLAAAAGTACLQVTTGLVSAVREVNRPIHDASRDDRRWTLGET